VNRWLIAALLVGALVRLPGLAWGLNWPDGFALHHPDEYTHVDNADAIMRLLEPDAGRPYPKAMAAWAAAPFLLWHTAADGVLGGPRVRVPLLVGAGRLVSLLFGLAAIALVFAIGRDALGDARAGVFGAWLLALGGLHVTQSHFFLSDVPAVTLTLLAVWLLWRDLTMSSAGQHDALRWAAFAAGAAVAFKLLVFALPAVVYAACARAPRPRRLAHAAVFGIAGVAVASLGFDGTPALYRSVTMGINYPFEFDRLQGALVAAVQMPAIFSLPLLLLATYGTWDLLRRLRNAPPLVRRHALVVFGTVPLVGLAFVLGKLDPFPRHWVFLIPWAAVAGGWALARGAAWLERRGRSPLLLLAPVMIWMAAFVVDGERYFVFEPRNEALRWVRAHVPEGATVYWTRHRALVGYQPVRWPHEGEPDVLVLEMYDANNALSGTGWRNSYPEDPARVFDAGSPERVFGLQALFRGEAPYRLTARFPDAYVMPEYRLAAHLLGDRARSYITEIVIFTRDLEASGR
jgi:hypothetical protein